MLTTHLEIVVEVEVQELEPDLQVNEVSAITPNNSSNPNPNPTIPHFHNSPNSAAVEYIVLHDSTWLVIPGCAFWRALKGRT